MNQIRKSLFLLIAVLFPLLAHAIGEPFTQQKLDALNKAGRPVVVAIHADWCTTCRAQANILKDLLDQPKFRGMSILRVDFDKQKPEVAAFGVENQSTLIVFKGGKEIDRESFETNPNRIAALLAKAL